MMNDWLKLAGWEGAGKHGKGEELWMVGKSGKIGFNARKKLIVGDKCFRRVERNATDDCGVVRAMSK